MINIAKIATIALAVIGGITLCTLFGLFAINLRELFERVDYLEEIARKQNDSTNCDYVIKIKKDRMDDNA